MAVVAMVAFLHNDGQSIEGLSEHFESEIECLLPACGPAKDGHRSFIISSFKNLTFPHLNAYGTASLRRLSQ